MAGKFTKITVNLTPRAALALELASQTTGDSRTDTIGRAIQIYAFVQQLSLRDSGSISVVHADGVERIQIS